MNFNNIEDRDKDKNWFLKTAINSAVLAGGMFGFYKLKGPASDIIKKIQEERFALETKRAFNKNLPLETRTGADFQLHPDYLKRRASEIFIPKELRNIVEEEEILNFEKEIVRKGSRIFSPYQGVVYDFSSVLFADSKINTLQEFFRKEGAIDSATDVSTINRIKGILNNSSLEQRNILKQLDDIHKKYLLNQKYARSYFNSLKILNTNTNKIKNNFNNSSKLPTYGDLKNFMYGNYGNQTLSKSRIQFYNSKLNIKPSETYDLMKEDVFRSKQFTASSSLNRTGHSVDSDIFSKFEYKPYLDKLRKVLQSLSEDKQDITKMSNASMVMERYGESTYLKLLFTDLKGKTRSLYVPISIDGRMPSGRLGTRPKLDRIYTVGGNNGSQQVNKTQMVLKDLTSWLDSTFISRFDGDPDGFIRRLKASVRLLNDDLPTAENTLRDELKIRSHVDLPFQTVMTQSSRHDRIRYQLKEGLSSMNTIKNVAKKIRNGANNYTIHLDFETLSSEKSPNLMALSPETEWYKAGVVVGKVGNGKTQIIHAEDFSSDHHIRIFDSVNRALGEGKGWTDDMIKWLRRVTHGIDDSSGDLEVIEAYRQQCFTESKGNRGRSANTTDFVRKVAKDLITQFDNIKKTDPNAVITFVTKNGTFFDWKPIQVHAPEEWAFLKKHYGEIVDTHSVAYAQKFGKFGEEALGLNSLIKRMLGQEGLEMIDIDKPGNLEKVIDLLNKKNKGNKIEFNPEVLKYLNRNKLLSKAHASPVLDNIANLLLYNRSIYDSQNDPNWYDSGMNSFGRLLNNGGHALSMFNQLEALSYATTSKVFGKVLGFNMMTQGMIADGVSSIMNMNSLFTFPDLPQNRQFDQMLAGVRVNPHSSMGRFNSTAGKWELSREGSKRFIVPLQTKDMHAFTLLKADTHANYFSHQVMVDTVHLWNSFQGKEGFSVISSDIMKQLSFKQFENIKLTDLQNFGFNTPEINNDLMNYVDEVQRIARAESGGKVTVEKIQEVSRRLAKERLGHMGIPLTNLIDKITGKPKTTKGKLNGKIVGLTMDPTSDLSDLMLELEYEASPEDIKRTHMVTRDSMNKASVTISNKLAYGVERIASMDGIDKAFVGSMKENLMMKVVTHYRNIIINNEGTVQAAQAKEAMKKIARRLNGTFLEKESIIVTNPDADLASTRKHIGSDFSKRANMFLGNVDLKFDDIMGFMSDAKLIWDHDGVEAYYMALGGGSKVKGKIHAEQQMRSAIDSHRRKIDAGYMKAQGLKEFDSARMQVEFDKMMKASFMPSVGSPVIMQLFNTNGAAIMKADQIRDNESYSWGMRSPVAVSFNSFNQGLDIRSGTMKIRNLDIANIEAAVNGGKSTLSPKMWNDFKNYFNFQRNVKFREAHKNLRLMTDTLMGKAVMTANLGVDDIHEILTRTGNKELREHFKNNINPLEIDTIREDITNLAKIGELTTEEINAEVDQIVNHVKRNKYDRLLADEKSRILSIQDINTRVLKYKKINPHFSDTSNDPKDIGSVFKVESKTLGLEHFELNLKTYISQVHDIKSSKQKDLEYKKLLLAFGDMAKNKNGPVISVNEGIVKMSALVFMAPRVNSLIANSIRGNTDFGYESLESRQQSITLNQAMKVRELIKGGAPNEDIGSQKELIGKHYLSYLDRALKMDPNSIFHDANIIEKPGTFMPLKGIGGAVTEAQRILNEGVEKELGHLSPDKIKHARSLLQKIVKNDFSLALIGEGAFDELISGDSLDIKYKQQIQGIFDRSGKSLLEDIRSGNKYAFGFFSRYPQTPNVGDAVLSNKGLVIPKWLQDNLKIDDNAAYVHASYMKFQNADFDGDSAINSMQNIKTIDEYWAHARDQRKYLREFAGRVDVQHSLSKNTAEQITDPTQILGFNSGNVEYVHYDGPNYSIRKTSMNNVNYEKMFDKFAGMTKEMVANDPTFVTAERIEQKLIQSQFHYISKQSIGMIQHSMWKGAAHLMQVGLVKDPQALLGTLGNLNIGIGGIEQQVIGFGKHGAGESLAKFSKTMEYFKSFDSKNVEGREFGRQLWNNSFEANGYKSDHVISDGMTANDLYNNLTGANELFQKGQKVDTELLLRSNSSLGDLMSGKNRGFFDHFLSTVSQDYNPSDNVFNPIQEDMLLQYTQGKSSRWGELKENLISKFPNLEHIPFKKMGKFGAIGAAAFLAANFVRPHQLSNSMNPLDMFSDLGTDLEYQGNSIFGGGDELAPGVALDSIEPSFSKQAFIKLNKYSQGDTNKAKSKRINSLLNRINGRDQFQYEFRSNPYVHYSNYTQNIGYIGDSNLNRLY